MKKIFTIAIIVSCLLMTGFKPANAAGAFFYLIPSTGTKAIDSVFSVSVKINTGDAVINAAEGTLNFDTGKLEVIGVSKSGSIFSLWTTEPSYNNSAGTISFGGGLPNPGYNGRAGTVITVSFKAKAIGEGPVNFSSGAILASDGQGTNILTSMGSANYTIAPASIAPKAEESGASATEAKPAQTDANNTGPGKVAVLNNKLNIMSATHPNQEAWYGQNTVELKWAMPPGATAESFAFDNSPATEPSASAENLAASNKYENVKDGIWYFHLKIKIDKDWSETSHYKIQIDTTPPAPFKISVNQSEAQDLPMLFFKTEDKVSGLVRYEVNIGSLEEKGFVVDPKETALKVPSLEIGQHTAMVKAIDRAGNESISTVEFTIVPIESPAVKNYSAELQPTDRLFMSGTALSNTDLILYIQREEGKVVTKKTTVDKNGLWYFINDEGLANGRYLAWAEAVNAKGLKSEPTPKISFLVTPPVFTRIGNLIINYFTIFVSLLVIIIIIILAIILLAILIRKRLRKETFEVEEVLHANMESLREMVEKELAKKSRAKTADAGAEKSRLRVSLKKNIDLTEKKIMKEIKDVENILK